MDYVDDNVNLANYTQDIDDQSLDNYGYDKLGQLVRDNSEGSMTIEWLSGNRKVKKITRTDKTIEFEYNPFGQRILKKVTDAATSAVTTSYYAYDANGQVMGVYDVNLTSNNASLNELNIYGASRIGMIDREVILCTAGTAAAPPVYPGTIPVTHTLGYKKYEIVNYLGNVNAVINDRKIYVGGMYEAVMIMYSDYYPFGMEMPGRNATPNKYRFGYNGMEKDDEVKNHSGSSYTTEFRQYDPRLGRWLSLDPLMQQFPWMSPYVAFNNNPVFYTDPLGLEGEPEGGEDGEVPQIVDLSQISKGGENKGAKRLITDYTDMKDVKGVGGKTVTIPSNAQTEYNSKGELTSFSYEYKDPWNRTMERNFVSRPSKSGNTTVYSHYSPLSGDENEVVMNYYSGGFYEDETEAYKAMWETTQNSDGTWTNTERTAYITEKGVWVSSNAFSGGDYSNHTIKTVVKDDKIYVNGERVLATIHTHPSLPNVGAGGFSGPDRQNSDNMNGSAFEIIMEFDGTASAMITINGVRTYINPKPENFTRDGLTSGQFKLIPHLKNFLK